MGLLPAACCQCNESGIRDFSELDIRWVEFIRCMRTAGLPVDVLTEQREILTGQIADMQKTLDLLNYKIKMYEERLVQACQR